MKNVEVLLTVAVIASVCSPLRADPAVADKLEAELANYVLPKLVRSAIGVTRTGTPIPCFISTDDLDLATTKTRILLIGGLDGDTRSIKRALEAAEWFHLSASDVLVGKYAVSCVPCANPDGWASGNGEHKQSDGRPAIGYPPDGTFYSSPTDPEAQYLWRWIGIHAPDLVIDVRAGEMYQWRRPNATPESLLQLANSLSRVASRELEADELVAALTNSAACETGSIPALQVSIGQANGERLLWDLFRALQSSDYRTVSAARRELQRRVARSPTEIAEQLSEHYGRELRAVVYIQSLAVIGRIRLGKLTGQPGQLRDAQRLAAPYVSGQEPTFGSRISGSSLSGHLVFSELARATKNPQYIALARKAADLGFDDNANPRESMPYHNEMSDSVFMGCPILAEVGQLTGDERYFEMCLRHLRFMQRHCLRDDGLYRHSPLDEAAWGRGNGFPALGLSLALSAIADDYSGRDEVLSAFQDHMSALQRHQDPDGTWHQVIDRPESYRELTATCMITFAMTRGVRRRWLAEDQFQPVIDRAWQAIKKRVASNGRLVDVCTGTGKQQNLRAYYDRTAILGPDPRGGAMSLMVSTEIAHLPKWLPAANN